MGVLRTTDVQEVVDAAVDATVAGSDRAGTQQLPTYDVQLYIESVSLNEILAK